MSATLASRIEALGTLPPRLRRAAGLLAQQPELVVRQPLRQLAAQAGVSPSTWLRLARLLGCDSFDQLRADALRALQQGDPGYTRKLRTLSRQGSSPLPGLPDPLLERAAQQAVDRVSSTLAMNAPAQVEQFAAACLGARRLYVMGLRSCFSLAYAFAYAERFVRSDVVLVSDVGGAPVDLLGDAAPQDALCVFSLAPYAREAVELARFAVTRGVPLLAVTDSDAAPYCRWTRDVLLFDARTPSFFPSQIGGLLLIEQIVLAQVAAAPGEARHSIERREALLQAVGAYFPTPRPGG